MASSTVDQIPRSGWVVKTVWIQYSIGNRCHAFIEVLMTKKRNINPVFDEEWFKSSLACVTLGLIDIPGTVAGDNDPGSLFAVDRGKVFLQPFKLCAIGRERTGVLVSASTGEIGGIRKLR